MIVSRREKKAGAASERGGQQQPTSSGRGATVHQSSPISGVRQYWRLWGSEASRQQAQQRRRVCPSASRRRERRLLAESPSRIPPSFQHIPLDRYLYPFPAPRPTGMGLRTAAALMVLLVCALRASGFLIRRSALSASSSSTCCSSRRRRLVRLASTRGFHVMEDLSDRPHPNTGDVVYVLDGTSMLYKVRRRVIIKF